jgi:raffinose/stachyose/melibiose transport system substrate-binding protein
VTLTVWDQNTDGGISKAQEQLNAEFHQKYPNVTIQRTVELFNDLKTTLKLALSSNTPPDVVQANQGYPEYGRLRRRPDAASDERLRQALRH